MTFLLAADDRLNQSYTWWHLDFCQEGELPGTSQVLGLASPVVYLELERFTYVLELNCCSYMSAVFY